jgi:hypothetical protein
LKGPASAHFGGAGDFLPPHPALPRRVGFLLGMTQLFQFMISPCVDIGKSF